MPNRIIKESICTSDSIDQLSLLAEVGFYRLLVNCDDFGRFDARPKVVKSRLFPLKDISEEDMQTILNELEQADLITIYHADGKPYLQMKTWRKHQQIRATKSKYPEPNDSTCNQMISDDIKCPRNRNRESIYDNRESSSLIGDDDAHEIQHEHDRILDAADDAGFKVSNSVRAALIRLYADYGLEKMLDGIASCVKHGATNLAYLEAVLKGSPKQEKPKVIAQDFKQRSYEDVDKRLMENLAKEVEQYKKEHPKEFEKQEGA